MKMSAIGLWVLAAGLVMGAEQTAPRFISVDPPSGKKGDVIAVTGENLTKASVDKVFLTDGKNDTPVEVTEQTEKTIKFKIPDKAPAGRLTLMILTGGSAPQYLEEPVKVEIQ